MTGLAELDSLKLSCRSDAAREYITEAISSYQNAAYRAAIITSWIAVVFDLIEKIRELAISGDKKASEVEIDLEKNLEAIARSHPDAIKKILEFERNILELCKDHFQFFEHQQYSDLLRLKEDRNRCAHPSFLRMGEPYKPSAEQARMHIVNTITHVLSQPAVQGRAAIGEVSMLISSNYFPTKKIDALAQLKASSLSSGTDALAKGLTEKLIYDFLTVGSPHYSRSQTIFALQAIAEIRPKIYELVISKAAPKIVSKASDKEFLIAMALVSRIPLFWESLGFSEKSKVQNYITLGALEEIAQTLRHFHKLSELKTIVETRISSFSADELATAISSGNIGELAVKRAIVLLGKCKNWNDTNRIFDKLILPIFEFLTPDDIRKIIKLPTDEGSDLPHAHMYAIFIGQVANTKAITTTELDDLLVNNGAEYLTPVT